MTRLLALLKTFAGNLKRDILTLMFVARDRSAPLLPKILAAFVAAYALSPVDLIPDFIPVIGYLDDLLIVPAGIWLCLRLTPPEVIVRNRQLAQHWLAANADKPRSYLGLAIVICLWGVLAWWLAGLFL